MLFWESGAQRWTQAHRENEEDNAAVFFVRSTHKEKKKCVSRQRRKTRNIFFIFTMSETHTHTHTLLLVHILTHRDTV